MRLIATLLVAVAVFAVACGGSDDDDGDATGSTGGATVAAQTGASGSSPTAAPEATATEAPRPTQSASTGATGSTGAASDGADAIAHEAIIGIEDLPEGDWLVTAEDDFGSGGSDFGAMIEGNPDCQALSDLAALSEAFGGGDDDDEAAGMAQIEIENQDPAQFVPVSIESEIEIEDSAGGSQAQFQLVKGLFESDDTANCLVSALNEQFAQQGLPAEVSRGTSTVEAPENGARMAFDVSLTIAGQKFEMAMQMFFWPYKNASAQVTFQGTNETLTDELLTAVLEAQNEKLKAAID